MSGSSRHANHSRRPRHADDLAVAVTEASLPHLAFSPNPARQHYSTPISPYQASEPQYHRPAYARGDPGTGYLQPTYETSSFAATPPGSFPIVPSPNSQIRTRSPTYKNSAIPSHAQTMPGPDMSTYAYMQSPMPGSAHGSYHHPTDYYHTQASSLRSMSASFPPRRSSDIGLDSRIVEEREVARQRRRNSQESRRQSKLRMRQNRLPSILNAGLASTQVTGGSVDSSLAAPSTMTTYVSDPIDRPYPSTSYASTRGGYSDVVSGGSTSYARPHEPYNSMTVNPYHTTLPVPSSVPFTDTRRPSPMLAPSHPEPVILDRREKPRCYEHGCNGREFSTFSNLLRHQREKSGSATKSYCPNCGAEFTRTTARNGHMEHGKCKPRRTSDS